MSPAEAKALLALMQAAWPRRGFCDDDGELTSVGILYARKLGGFAYADAFAAIDFLIDTSDYGPSPAMLRRTVRTFQSNRLAGAEQVALEAENPITPEEAGEVARMIREFLDDVGVQRGVVSESLPWGAMGRVQTEVAVGAELADPERHDLTDEERVERQRAFEQVVADEEAKDRARERLNAAISEEIEAQEEAQADSEEQAAKGVETISEPSGL